MEAGRIGNGYGLLPWSWADLAAFFRFDGVTPAHWQIKALREMEHKWLVYKNTPADQRPSMVEATNDAIKRMMRGRMSGHPKRGKK